MTITLLSIQLPLPDLVCAREAHSIANCKINFNTQWIIVVGGEVDYTEIQGHLVTIIIEIGMDGIKSK